MSERSRILVVEDDDGLRDTIVEVLSDEGHEVRMASNGRDALQTLASWEADLVVLDLMMPAMDGFQFREHQLASASDPPPLLVLSAARDLENAANRLQANAFLPKPFLLSEMISVVDDLLDRA